MRSALALVWEEPEERIGYAPGLPNPRPFRKTWIPRILPDIYAAISLVGVEGTVASASGTTITPTIPQSSTGGNCLIAWITSEGSGTTGIISSSSSGWLQAVEIHATTTAVAIWYKPNCGVGEANPTFTSTSATYLRAKINEYSGVLLANPVDQTGSASGTTSPLSIAATAADFSSSGNLVVAAFGARYSSAGTKTLTDSLNNGAVVSGNVNDGATSAVNHYDFCSWGITTGNSSVNTDSLTFTTTNISVAKGVIASFKTAPFFPVRSVWMPGRPYMAPAPKWLRFQHSQVPTSQTNVFLNLTASDVLAAVSDTATRLIALPRTVADALSGLSEAITRNVSLPRTVSDTLGALTDIATRLIALPRTATDALGALSDSAVRAAMSFLRTANDSLSVLSDVATRLVAFQRTGTDVLSALTETITLQKGISRTASDTLSALSDVATRGAKNVSRIASDGISALSDLTTKTQTFTRVASDALGAIGESVTAVTAHAITVVISFVVYGRSGIVKVLGRTGMFTIEGRSAAFKVFGRMAISRFLGRFGGNKPTGR